MVDANRPLSQAEIDALLEALASANDQEEKAIPSAETPAEPPREASPSVPPGARAEEAPSAPPVAAAPIDPRLQRTLSLPVTVSVSLGAKKLPVQALLEWGVGTQVVLDYPWQQPVQIKINGLAVGEGRVVLVGNNFGIEVRRWGTRR